MDEHQMLKEAQIKVHKMDLRIICITYTVILLSVLTARATEPIRPIDDEDVPRLPLPRAPRHCVVSACLLRNVN
jgi:hypothetical protein